MKVFFKISLMALALLLFSCGSRDDSKEAARTGVADEDTPQLRAFNMMKEGRPFEEYMAEQLKAVEELREGRSQLDPVDILSQTGWFYTRHGDYVEALTYLQEASDSLQARSLRGDSIDVFSIRNRGNLSGLYVRFGLYDEALHEIDLAISSSEANGNIYASDLWRMRGNIFEDMLKNNKGDAKALADSMIFHHDKARDVIEHMPELGDKHLYLQKTNFTRAGLFVEYPHVFGDSIPKAINLLENFHMSDETSNISAEALLGRALVLTGDRERGLRKLEDAYRKFEAQNWTESKEWALDLLVKSYMETGNAARLLAIMPEYLTCRDSLMSREKLNAVIGADFRYKSQKKTEEAEYLKVKNEQAHRIIIFETVAIVLGVFLSGALLFILYSAMLKVRREKEEAHAIINDILSHQHKLNMKIEELTIQKEHPESSEVINEVVESLNPSLLSREDENRFRKAFAQLYPHFLRDLRTDFPDITANDEVICMLIYLKMPPSDISMCVGISRMSLNSARYRIRKKLNLDKEIDLDEFLCSRRK